MPVEAGPLTRALRAAGGFLLRVPWVLALLMWVGWGAVIFDLSSQRRPVATRENALWEWLSNLAHAPLFGLFALFAAALCYRVKGGGWPRATRGRGLFVVALTLAYGLADEWHQSTVPGRDASFLDVVTDGVAAAMVVWVIAGLELGERRLRWRLVVGVLLCGLAALAASAF
jgi:VanZ family protein